MLKTTLLAAAAVVAFGSTTAYAAGAAGTDGPGHRVGHGGAYEVGYRGGPYTPPYGAPRHGHSWKNKYHRYGPAWFDYRGRPYCHYEPRKVRIKVWDRRGNPYRKWVWKDVKVCA